MREVVQIRSLHYVKFWSRGGARKTYCGRWASALNPITHDITDGKSCETCLRIAAKQDAAG